MTNENRQARVFRTFGIRNSAFVILLTLLAGCLRFYSIDKPSIWGDEAATWRRISGSYQQLVDELRSAGFMPGAYLLDWWIKEGFPVWGHYEYAPPTNRPELEGGWFRRVFEGRDPARSARMAWTPSVRLVPGGITPTPLVMRFVPALCGTLMVPAMYFLASRLVSRRTALLTALFTCCSAYMLNYSRDAKMYMQLWFFATLHVGCLLWWLEAYKRRPRELARLSPARPWSAKQAELGEGVAGVLPADHVGQVARAFITDADIRPMAMIEPRVPRLETFLRFACWLTAGLAMIAFHAVGLAIVGIELLIVLATIPQRSGWVGAVARRVRRRIGQGRSTDPAYVSAAYEDESLRPSLASHFRIPPLASFLVGAYCIVALFLSYREFSRFYARVEPPTTRSVQYDVDDAGIGWVEPYNAGRTAGGHFLENATAFLMSWEWPKSDRDAEAVNPVALVRLQWSAIVLLIAIAAGLVPWKALLDRITSAPRERGPMPATALLIVAAWLVVPAYGMYAASGTWSDTGAKVFALSPAATLASAVFPAATPGDIGQLRGALASILRPLVAGDVSLGAAWSKVVALPWSQLFVVHGIGDVAVRWWAVAIIACVLLVGALAWRRPGIARYDDEIEPDRSLRRRRIVAWWGGLVLHALAFCVALIGLLALLILAFVTVPPQERSLWMPRYLGFVWPAFAIAVCVLIRRLPLLPVRCLVVAALLAVNLTVFYHRMNLGEPPTALMAKDQIAAGDRRTARVFAADLARPQFGGPGAGGVFSMPAAYYFVTMSGLSTTPRTAYDFTNREQVATRIGGNYANVLRATLRRDLHVNDVYVWAQLPVETPASEFAGKIAAAISPGWTEAEPARRWTIYDHWTWKQLLSLERYHWKREPTTKPTSRPMTKSQ